MIQGKTRDTINFNHSISDLIMILIGDDAYQDQLNYLQETRKPRNTSVTEWTRRVKKINSYLEILKKCGKSLSEAELVQQVLAK